MVEEDINLGYLPFNQSSAALPCNCRECLKYPHEVLIVDIYASEKRILSFCKSHQCDFLIENGLSVAYLLVTYIIDI